MFQWNFAAYLVVSCYCYCKLSLWTLYDSYVNTSRSVAQLLYWKKHESIYSTSSICMKWVHGIKIMGLKIFYKHVETFCQISRVSVKLKMAWNIVLSVFQLNHTCYTTLWLTVIVVCMYMLHVSGIKDYPNKPNKDFCSEKLT